MRISRYVDGEIPDKIKGETLNQGNSDHYLNPEIELSLTEEQEKSLCQKLDDGELSLMGSSKARNWLKRNKMNIALGLAIYGGYRIATRRS